MPKIWLKAPDSSRQCCGCEGKSGPCDNCCILYSAYLGFAATLADAQSFFAGTNAPYAVPNCLGFMTRDFNQDGTFSISLVGDTVSMAGDGTATPSSPSGFINSIIDEHTTFRLSATTDIKVTYFASATPAFLRINFLITSCDNSIVIATSRFTSSGSVTFSNIPAGSYRFTAQPQSDGSASPGASTSISCSISIQNLTSPTLTIDPMIVTYGPLVPPASLTCS